MHNQELKELLINYREQKCSREELVKLWSFAGENENEGTIKAILLEDLEQLTLPDTKNESIDFQGIFRNIISRIGELDNEKVYNLKVQGEKRRFVQFLKIASIMLIFFLGGGVLSYFVFETPEESSVVSYNEIKAPLGARSEILLPDGSRVWLNAGSKIRYLNGFNEVNRNVVLDGEAYFKIAKNSKIPFNVKTGDLNIVAIGTEFNVKSYDDEGIIETTLVEGKVSISQNDRGRKKSQTVFLESHQKAVYIKEDQQLTVEDLKAVQRTKPDVLKLKKGIMYVADKVDPAPVVSWKQNRLILKGEELSSLLIKLERKYDVKFLYESDEIKQFHFTGTLENETLTQVLDVIKLSAPIEYTLEGKTVKISENKQMTKKFSGHLKKK